MSYKIKYPREIISFIKSGLNEDSPIWTFSVENHLEPAAEKPSRDKDFIQSPMNIFAEYARFRMTVIQKYGEKSDSPYANLTIDDFEEIKVRSDFANRIILETEYKNNFEDPNSERLDPAYTQNILIGKCKGKTPAQALLESPDNKEVLEKNASWLKERASAHPNNQKQYEAIISALDLYEKGKIAVDVTQTNSVAKAVTIHKGDIKPLANTMREDGKCLVYQINISCEPGQPYPYRVEIENFYAACNGVIPVMSTACDKVNVQMTLSMKQWASTLAAMKRTMDIYIITYGKYELTRSVNYIKSFRKK